MHVLLATEGTYPFVDGGVTTWCAQLIDGLPDVRYTVYAVTGDVTARPLFDVPRDTAVVQVPLWGVEHPSEWGLPAGGTLDLIRRTRAAQGSRADEFAELLTGFLDDLDAPQADPAAAARRLVALHRFFLEYDMLAALGSDAAWDALVAAARRSVWAGAATIGDLTACMRWLRALMMPLAVPVPEADLTHITIAGLAAVPGIIARLERGTPMIVTEHGVALRERYLAILTDRTLSDAQGRFMVAVSELMTAITYALADVVAPVCAWNGRWERRLGVKESALRVIHNGVDPTIFVPHDKPSTSPGADRPTAVAAARVYSLKDIETMIRAAARTREHVPDALFVVYGSLTADKPYTARCRALITELGLEADFLLAGLAPEPTEIFNQGDIAVLSSVSEAFPYTVLEAMSCGRPVAATDVGGVREIIDGWGELVPPRDPVALGDACARLLADGRRRGELGRRGRERVLARFRAATVATQYRALYQEFIVERELVSA